MNYEIDTGNYGYEFKGDSIIFHFCGSSKTYPMCIFKDDPPKLMAFAKCIHDDYKKKQKEIEMSGKKDVVQFEMGTDSDGYTYTGLSLDRLQIIGNAGLWEKKNLKPNTQYAVRMIAVPDGYRVATYEEARACSEAKAFTYRGWALTSRAGGARMHDVAQYIVPKETEEDRRRKSIMDRIEAAEEELRNAKEELNKGE